MRKEQLTWADLQGLTETIFIKLRLDNWFPNLIVGLTRGGLLPAKMLSHALNVEMSALNVSLRDSKILSPTTTYLPRLVNTNKYKILVVDDINDTGATFEWIRKDWANTLRHPANEWPSDYIKFAALLHNEPSPQLTDYYGRLINKDQDPVWIEFPYEVWHKSGRHNNS